MPILQYNTEVESREFKAIESAIESHDYREIGRLAFRQNSEAKSAKEFAERTIMTAGTALIYAVLEMNAASNLGDNTALNCASYYDKRLAVENAPKGAKKPQQETVAEHEREVFSIMQGTDSDLMPANRALIKDNAPVAHWLSQFWAEKDEQGNPKVQLRVVGNPNTYRLVLAVHRDCFETIANNELVESLNGKGGLKMKESSTTKPVISEYQLIGESGYPKMTTLRTIAKDWENLMSNGKLGKEFVKAGAGASTVTTSPETGNLLELFNKRAKEGLTKVEEGKLIDVTLQTITILTHELKAEGIVKSLYTLPIEIQGAFIGLKNVIEEALNAEAIAEAVEKAESAKKLSLNKPEGKKGGKHKAA